ncbi:MAG: pyridoxamine 5'-phosphate oxidase family protein [Candidatus Bathyarchaeota archaeon]|jgi:nitroimidazol reductase NimA-like FMN-containing flavoprotein (pyridoxamine 5'-phosphate oxidase superfamily)|nr:pyridoxamine 5'-phosphate oxidase family protein [Candidatus Bathyarchaeota archaeon]
MYLEMRRNDKKMSMEETKSFLRDASVGRLAMSKDDQPYVIPINFVYFKEKIFFHCAREGQKISSLLTNSFICFEVDEFLGMRKGRTSCTSTVKYRSVIAFGKASFVDDVDAKKKVLTLLVKKYVGAYTGSFDEETFERTLLVAITVERMTGKKSL